MPGPRQLVSPPTFADRNYGLLSVVQPRYDEPESKWRNGVTWSDLCGSGGVTYDPSCLPSGTGNTPATKADNIDFEHFGAQPFTVFGEVDCSPVGYSVDEQRTRAVDAMTRTEAYQVERAFWTGAAGGDSGIVLPHLAANATVEDSATQVVTITLQCAATEVTGVALDAVEGLGRLEAAASACYQGQLTLHVPTVLGERLMERGLIKPDGGQLKTVATNNLVALGAGYPGTSPAGATPTNAVWVYATGPVFAYRSAPETFRFQEMLDRDTNLVKSIVERTYVLGYSCCCLYAVAISVGGDVTGQPQSAF